MLALVATTGLPVMGTGALIGREGGPCNRLAEGEVLVGVATGAGDDGGNCEFEFTCIIT